ncbi:MAG TPA: S8 family serine peptidase, partial [Symbiobacteriaceae bacterium]|nr:S8 family serine peptidase [Symbiobacteriaceae bacterium]
MSVCAMRDVGESGWSLAPFSSRGPTADGRIKPDICAPGYRISAPRAGTADRYTVMSGTSMASPVVAGVAALLLEANPYLTVDEVKDTLFSTAQDWGAPGKDIDYGWGRLNAYRAVQRVLGLPGVGPSNPTHALGRGTIAEGQELWYRLNVTDAGMPIAATLLATD